MPACKVHALLTWMRFPATRTSMQAASGSGRSSPGSAEAARSCGTGMGVEKCNGSVEACV